MVIRRGRKIDDDAVLRADIDVCVPNEFGNIDQPPLMLGEHEAIDDAAGGGSGRTS